MKKYLLKILATTLLLGANAPAQLKANDDVIRVQTLTFDSIVTRRSVWQFPNTNDKYRKIIMNYTLKCDPKTPHDQYNCGEWDYLTYTLLHHKTGRDTSFPMTHPKFKLGGDASAQFKIIPLNTNTPPEIINTFSRTKTTISSAADETSMDYLTPTMPTFTGNKPFRVQYLILNSDLKATGFNKKTIGKLKLNFSQANSTLKNLKIKFKNSTLKSLPSWENDMVTVYDNDFIASQEGWNEINLNQDFITKTIYGLIVEISADGFTDESASILGNNSITLNSSGIQNYLKFDGKNDYVYSTNSILNNATKFTMEANIKIDKWSNWSKVLGVGDKLHFETGDTPGDLYFMVRNGMNSYGKATTALKVGTWAHVAVVFDGTKETNEEKLKMYINGVPVSLTYSGVLPNFTAKQEAPFTVSSLEWSSACINGCVSDVRVWDTNLSADDVKSWFSKSITNSHPNYNNLLLNYTFQNITDFAVTDLSPHKNNGSIYGLPEIENMKPEQLLFISETSNSPALQFVNGTYQRNNETQTYTVKKNAPMMSLAEYVITDHKPVISKISKVWAEGYYYTYNEAGAAIDSVFKSATETVTNQTLNYNTAPTQVVQDIEIGRFITPYGKGLDLGPDGFTWQYDVTDYAQYLKGDVELSAGNLQELLDVSFDFYKGIPPREVIKMDEIWGSYGDYKYKDLSNDDVLTPISISLDPATKQTKIKTRITGHGHYSNNMEYPHCCEWKDNTHTLDFDGNTIDWKIWQENDCALNPVFPQGGTWPGAREGWCPGDVVKENDFEISDYIYNQSLSMDYSITPVPTNNLGMGNGNYVMAMQLVEYGEQTHQVDAEVYDVFAPNNFPLYSRKNPLCAGPKVVIRNNGKDPLTKLKFNYGVSGGTPQIYDWKGSIASNLRDTIDLPISSSLFWMGDGQKKFTVQISEPNGVQDNYNVNDAMTTSFNLPDIIEKGSTLVLQMPKKYQQYIHMNIKDMNGNIVLNRNGVSAGVTYKDPLNFEEGCYTMEILSDINYGISYWAADENGDFNGSLKLLKPDGTISKVFKADFGNSLRYSFSIGSLTSVEDNQIANIMDVFPNPATNEVSCRISEDIGLSDIEIFDASGKLISKHSQIISKDEAIKLDISNYITGSYYIRIYNSNFDIKKNFIKK